METCLVGCPDFFVCACKQDTIRGGATKRGACFLCLGFRPLGHRTPLPPLHVKNHVFEVDHTTFLCSLYKYCNCQSWARPWPTFCWPLLFNNRVIRGIFSRKNGEQGDTMHCADVRSGEWRNLSFFFCASLNLFVFS
jgi:hypothetical protein